MIDRPPLQPPCPRGFEHINRYWDERHQVWAVDKVVPLNKVAHAVMHFIAQHA